MPQYNSLVMRRVRVSPLVAAVIAGSISAAAVDIADAADVDLTSSTNNGISLDSFVGATAQVSSGVTINNTTFTNRCNTFSAICASAQAWTLTNNGTIGPPNFGDGVHFTDGGAVVNFGSIDGGNGILIGGGTGASVDNKAGATIHGSSGAIVIGDFFNPVAGVVTNAGTITSDGQAVGLNGGGIVTNLAGALIQGHADSIGVAVVQGTSREVDNSGTIQSNDFGFATGVSLEDGVLVNQASGKILGAYNGVFANGSNATNITNAGLIEASKAAAMFGTPGSAIEADGGGTIVNSGIIRSMSVDGSDVGILFSGAGSITNSGTIGSLDGGLAISFQGSDSHTLTLGTGSILLGSVQGGAGTDNLVLKGRGSETLGKFLGFETLSMQGTDWTLNGTGNFATSADIENGHLHVNGTLTVPTLSILPGATLNGVGAVVGAVNNRGVIAPGNSIGTLTASNVLFSRHSIFEVEINPKKADKLVVTGAVTIAPTAKVRVEPAQGVYRQGQQYLILDAGTRNGTFAGVVDDSAFLGFALDNRKNPNQVWLDVTQVAAFSDFAATPNQKATAAALNSLGSGNPIFDAIAQLDAADARRAFDLSSGEVYASTGTVLLDDSRFLREAAIDRLRQRFDADFANASASPAPLAYADEAAASPGDWAHSVSSRDGVIWSSWGQAFSSWGDFAGDGNAASLSRAIGGFVAGADATIAETWRLGLAGGYQSSSLDIPDRASSASVAGYDLAAYAGYEHGPVALRLGGAYTWYDVDTSRTVAFTGFGDSVGASYRAHAAQAFGELGYDVHASAFDIEPLAGLAYVNLATDGFAEKGGAAALTVAAGNEDITFASLGARFGSAVPLGDGRARIDGLIAWQHAFDNLTPTSTLAFNGTAGAPFTIAGIPIATDALRLEAGLDWALSQRASFTLAYSGEIAARVQDHGLKAKLAVSF